MATQQDGLKMTPSMVAGGSLVKLEGVLDESIEASRLAGGQGGVLVLDLDQVWRVTSFGVREWIRALAAAPRDYLGFVRCRPAVVSQFNMVRKFASGGELLSFYAPYLCGSCGKEYEELLDARKQRAELTSFT